MAKTAIGETTENISFGAFALEECDLLSMHHMQADGYFEAQATASLATRTEGTDEPEAQGEEDFQNQVSQVTQTLVSVQKEEKKKQTKKRGKKMGQPRIPESGTEEEGQKADAEFGNDTADPFEEEAGLMDRC